MKLFDIMQTSFDAFDETIRTYLSKTFNNLGIQYTHSQIFGVIFDGIRGIMQNMMFYIEDAMNEQNIFTAIRKKSVYSLAKISGYEAYYGSTPTGILIGKLQLNNGLTSKATRVYIKNHARVQNRMTGIMYSIVLPTSYYVYDVSKPLVTHEFKIVQGMFTTSTYVAKGIEMETIHISIAELFDKEYLKVSVNGEDWTRVYNFYDMTENGKEYLVSVGFDNAIDITFGNNLYGKRLNSGDTVLIEYLRHSGDLGNILPNEISDFIFAEYSYDTLGNSVNSNDYMKLSVSTCISGGTNSDSIEFIRSMVGSNSRSLVLASEDNFKLFFKRFSFIGYVNCWSETNSMVVIATCLRNFMGELSSIDDYYNIPVENMLLTTEQKEMIINTLNNSNRAFAGITFRFQDPIIRRYAFICYVKIDSVYNQDTAKSEIRKCMANYFMNLPSDCTFIAKSDLIKYILDNSTTLKSIDIDIISEAAEQAYYNGYYDKYEMKFVNGTYEYKQNRVIYEHENQTGIDNYGNIQLDSKMEIPVLHGGFKYYVDKQSNNKTDYIVIDDIQVYFI